MAVAGKRGGMLALWCGALLMSGCSGFAPAPIPVTYLSQDPPQAGCPLGRPPVDDGRCPPGQVKRLIGGDAKHNVPERWSVWQDRNDDVILQPETSKKSHEAVALGLFRLAGLVGVMPQRARKASPGTRTQPSIRMRAERDITALVTVHCPATCSAWAPTLRVPEGDRSAPLRARRPRRPD